MLDMVSRTVRRWASRPINGVTVSPSTPIVPSITPEQKTFFEENGYLILPRLFSDDLVQALRVHFDELWKQRSQHRDVAIDIYFKLPGSDRTYFRRAPDEARNSPYKIMDMHLEDALIRDACTAPAMVGAVGALLGATPLVCNSLLFEWGSQQEPHFDTFFMPSNTRNMMAASWVALDSVTKTNGPLFYYPKSHLIEPYRFSHGGMKAILPELQTGAAAHIDRIIREYELKKEEFYPEAGDVLIWHAQLLHGGSPIVNREETRRSLVTHYWTEVDFPLPEQRIDVGDRRWVLKKPHSTVVDDEILAEVDVFLATMTPSPEMLSGVPETFDARRYLARNPDVLRAGESPWQHYINHGQREGRFW